MILNEKEIRLNKGQICILRSPGADDAEKLLEYLRMTAVETNFLLRYPEEVTLTLEEERNFIKSIRENPRAVMICAFIGDRLVGSTNLNPLGERFKISHRAAFGIAVLKEAWHLGIGRALISEILKIARDTGYELVELEVASRNYKAIKLYESFGFKIYGTRENGFKFKDGTYDDEHLMLKKLV